ncbi:MAG: GerMN domain-containing protein [Caldicoprobacterales bacterium]|jgi:germination protein M
MLQKKIWLPTAMLLAFILIFTSCSKKNEKNEEEPHEVPTITNETEELTRETIVYYKDDAGYLVPVMRKIPWVEGIAKYTLRIMMDTSEQQEDLMMMGLRPLLPGDTEILGMSIKEGIAKLDLNNAVLNCKDAAEETSMIQGIVMTLSEFSTIDKVQFLFEGQVLETMPHGTYVKEPIGPTDINLETSDDASANGAKVKVFFQSTSPSLYDYLIPITRVTTHENSTLETSINELLQGPMDTDNMTIDIPPDTKLLGIQMDGGVTYINFSKEFNEIANSKKSEEMVLRAVKLTALQYPEVEEVKILVEGKEYSGSDIVDEISVFANEW